MSFCSSSVFRKQLHSSLCAYFRALNMNSNLTKWHKERARNNLNNSGTGFLFLTQQSQEAHSCSTQRLRLLSQEQKDKPECSSYFVHIPKSIVQVISCTFLTLQFSSLGALVSLVAELVRVLEEYRLHCYYWLQTPFPDHFLWHIFPTQRPLEN